MTEKQEREKKIAIMTNILETNIKIMLYYREIASNKESKAICNKSIKESKVGIKMLPTINHIEIIRSLFNHLVNGKEQYYVMSGSLCSYDKIIEWDTTEDGFKEFIKLEDEGVKKSQQEFEEKQKQAEMIKKAQEEGKTVEMIYDNEAKKVKPIIVEEKSNA